MLALGKSAGDTTDVVHRLTARARLATVEEKQLQKTLKFVEQNVRGGEGGREGGREEWKKRGVL